MKILHILETAFRGTIEEQDDTVVWTVHAMKNSGLAGSILLQGNIVCHASRTQDASGLTLGEHAQTNPVDLAGDLTKVIAAGVPVYLVADDASARGLLASDIIDGVQSIDRAAVAGLCDDHDQVWHW